MCLVSRHNELAVAGIGRASFLPQKAEAVRMEDLSLCVSRSCQFKMAAAVGLVRYRMFCSSREETIAGKDSPDRGVGALFSQQEGRDTLTPGTPQ